MIDMTLWEICKSWLYRLTHPNLEKWYITVTLRVSLAIIGVPLLNLAGVINIKTFGVEGIIKWDNQADYIVLFVGVLILFISAFFNYRYQNTGSDKKTYELHELIGLLNSTEPNVNVLIQSKFTHINKYQASVDEIRFLMVQNNPIGAMLDHKYAWSIIELDGGRLLTKDKNLNLERSIKRITKTYFGIGVVSLLTFATPLFIGVLGQSDGSIYTLLGLLIALFDIMLIPSLRKYSCAKRLIELPPVTSKDKNEVLINQKHVLLNVNS